MHRPSLQGTIISVVPEIVYREKGLRCALGASLHGDAWQGRACHHRACSALAVLCFSPGVQAQHGSTPTDPPFCMCYYVVACACSKLAV